MVEIREQSLDERNGVGELVAKLRARDSISREEEQVLHDAVSEVRHYDAGRTLVRAGTLLSESMLLVDGVVSRHKDLANGERQIQEIHVAGDFTDLHGFLLKRLDHNIGTITRSSMAIFPHDNLRKITEGYPHLTRMLWFSTMLDAAIQRETILSIGRRSALARIGHLMCELSLRLKLVGLSEGCRFLLPMTQMDLADATGLTSVHVNRMLRQLREQGLMTFRSGEVVIHDWARLARVAEFDPVYLHIERIER
jgi:CRP-like cAMP-binding protein